MELTTQKELMVFRRRRETDDITTEDAQVGPDGSIDAGEVRLDDARSDPPATSPEPAVPADAPPAAPEPYAVAVPTRPNGPWDSADVPKDDDVDRIDLGGIHLPVPDGIEVRVEVQDDVPMAATLVDGPNALQVHAFAAPRSSGLWAEVREEISASLRGSGGGAEQTEGPFGPELRAQIPAETGGTQPARFIGVDGPRWFLRGLLTGPGSTDALQSGRLEAAFRDIVVHRGSDAMAPRDMIPLHLPREALDAMPDQMPENDAPSLQLPERGPEITEIQ